MSKKIRFEPNSGDHFAASIPPIVAAPIVAIRKKPPLYDACNIAEANRKLARRIVIQRRYDIVMNCACGVSVLAVFFTVVWLYFFS